jgi:hypothetical protein
MGGGVFPPQSHNHPYGDEHEGNGHRDVVRYRAAAPVELVCVHAKQALLAAINREQSSKEIRGERGD